MHVSIFGSQSYDTGWVPAGQQTVVRPAAVAALGLQRSGGAVFAQFVME